MVINKVNHIETIVHTTGMFYTFYKNRQTMSSFLATVELSLKPMREDVQILRLLLLATTLLSHISKRALDKPLKSVYGSSGN